MLSSLEIFVICLIAAIIGSILYVAYDDATSEKISITKKNWECTKEETSTYVMPMQSGSTTMYVPMTQTNCVEYKKK